MFIMKISTINKKGQIVIPNKYRQQLNINEYTHIKIYIKDDIICLKPLNNISEKEKIISFKKNNEIKPFHFIGKNKKERNMASKIDSIIMLI